MINGVAQSRPSRRLAEPVGLDSRGAAIRCIVVDDHPAVRLGVRELLAIEPDFEVLDAHATAEGALASAEPESAVSDVEFALVGMTAPGDFLLIFFVFHLPVSRNLRPCSRELQPVLMEGFSPIRLLPVLRLAGHYGLSRRAWPGGPAQGGLGEKSLAPDGPR